MAWFRRDKAHSPDDIETRAITPNRDNPAYAGWFGYSSNYAGVSVNEESALGLSAVYRATAIISSTIASLPLKTYREMPDGSREQVSSVFDNPAGPDSITSYEWIETVVLHLLLHGNAYLLPVKSAAGAVVGYELVHPLAVSVERAYGLPEGKLFKLSMADGSQKTLTAADLVHIPGPCTDGLKGLSPLHIARNSFGITIAGERAAASLFRNGTLAGGLVTPEEGEQLPPDDAQALLDELNAHSQGVDNAGKWLLTNAHLKFENWSLPAKDLQFLESRTFQIEEIARWFGVPKVLLAQDGASSWGSGMNELIRSMGRFTFLAITERIEQRLSRLLPSPRFVEFEYAQLERPNAADQIALGISQVNGGVMTVNEYRALQNLAPVAGGDELRVPSGVMLMSQLEASAAAIEAEVEPANEAPSEDEAGAA